MTSTSKSRNYHTGKAIQTLDNNALDQLLENNDSGYIRWEKKYIQKRFKQSIYLSQLKKDHTAELLNKQNDDNQLPKSPKSVERLINEQEKKDIMLQKRFNEFAAKHNGDKPLLILDVDNTMLYVRFFSEEMRIGDVVTYFESNQVIKNNAKVLKLQITLSLEITDSQLIDHLNSERTDHSFWVTQNTELLKYKKNGVYKYILNTDLIACKILKVEVSGCVIEVGDDGIIDDNSVAIGHVSNKLSVSATPNKSDTFKRSITIDFTSENDNLAKLEPCLNRSGMLPIDFIYEGFLIRLRPNLDEFLDECLDNFDIVIYTSAKQDIYKPMLVILHEYIKDQLGRKDETDLSLWTDVLYRDDCQLTNDINGKPYHHKDITLFGCHLSRVIMIDNSPIVLSGEEPNSIFIRDFFGKDGVDDEFMEISSILDTISDIKGDIRYCLCDIDDKVHIIDKKLDFTTLPSCFKITSKFLKTYRKYHSKHSKRRKSISISVVSVTYSNTVASSDNITHKHGTPIPAMSVIDEHTKKQDQPPLKSGPGSSPMWRVERGTNKPNKKWKKRNKSLLHAPGVNQLAERRHSRYSSMSPKIEDIANFDIRPSINIAQIDQKNYQIIYKNIDDYDDDNKAIDIDDYDDDFRQNIDHDGNITDMDMDSDDGDDDDGGDQRAAYDLFMNHSANNSPNVKATSTATATADDNNNNIREKAMHLDMKPLTLDNTVIIHDHEETDEKTFDNNNISYDTSNDFEEKINQNDNNTIKEPLLNNNKKNKPTKRGPPNMDNGQHDCCQDTYIWKLFCFG